MERAALRVCPASGCRGWGWAPEFVVRGFTVEAVGGSVAEDDRKLNCIG